MLSGAVLHTEIDQINLAYAARVAENVEEEEGRLRVPHHYIDLFLNNVPGPRMLDAGCGSARYVSEFLEDGMQYTGVDYSPDMVKVARERNPTLDFRVCNFDSLVPEFGTEVFDGLWACCVFGTMAKTSLPNKLAQMYEVLKPGGIAFIVIPLAYESGERVLDTEYGPVYHTSWGMEEFSTYLKAAGFTVESEAEDYLFSCITFLLIK